MRTFAIIIVAAACGASAPAPAPPPSNATAQPPACLADEIGPLRNAPQLDNACLEEPGSCERMCSANDPMACMYYGLELQRTEAGGNGPGSREAFGRACKLGLAIGCTNYAAGRLALVEAKPCTRRLFEAACAVQEPFGCAMIGRMMVIDAKTDADRAAASSAFERACADVGNVACFFYAVHLTKGDLGPADPAKVKTLLERACSTGYPEACGLSPS